MMADRKGVMLAHIMTDARLQKIGFPVICQPKLNGNRCLLVVKAGKSALYSSQGNLITSVPHISAAVDRMCEVYDERDATYDGELYVHGPARQELRSRIGRTCDLHHKYREVELHLFDLKVYDGSTIEEQPMRIRYVDRFESMFPVNGPIRRVTSIVANNKRQVDAAMSLFLRHGYEGIIVRAYHGLYEEKRSSNLLKLKPAFEMRATILDCIEEVSITGIPKDSLGAFKVRFENGAEGRVGTGFTQEERIQLWQNPGTLRGQVITVKYHELSNDGCPCPAVYKGIVYE